ncbi:hypothetical protein FACS1894201_01320 [Bacteroidia bacterium]|nr:hypothetical protein FACS1894201_01320 [Bacteroidia bacterium]
MVGITTANAQTTWDCGSPNASDVVATLNIADSTLTISGTGAMQDYSFFVFAPWHADRSAIKTVVIDDGITRIGD